MGNLNNLLDISEASKQVTLCDTESENWKYDPNRSKHHQKSHISFSFIGDVQVTTVVTKAQYYSSIGCSTLGKLVPGKFELAAKSIPGS